MHTSLISYSRPFRGASSRTAARTAALCALLAGTAAHAHHPMDGAIPATLGQGLLSGLAHPVIEIDHLLFLLACAMVLALSTQTWRQTVLPILAFVCAAAIAAFGQSFMPPVSGVEWGVEWAGGVGLLLAAAALWQQRAATLPVRAGPAALVGLVSSVGLAHGMAYGEAVIGAEATPMLSYLAGLSLVQAAAMGATVWLTRRLATLHSRHVSGVVRALAGLAAMAGVWVLGAAAVA